MTVEVVNTEFVDKPAPTSLDLFRCPRSEIQQLADGVAIGHSFRSQFIPAKEAWWNLNQGLKSRSEKIRQLSEELQDEEGFMESSVVTSRVYLKMSDELSFEGRTQQEILDLFKLCLRINTGITSRTWRYSRKLGYDRTVAILLSEGQKINVNQQIFDEEVGEPLVWFGQDGWRWREFVGKYHFFLTYLYPEVREKYKERLIPKADLDNYPCITLQEAQPDWLTEGSEGSIERLVVEKELEEDEQAFQTVKDRSMQLRRQYDYLIEVAKEKLPKAPVFFEKRRREFLASVKNFADLVIFLQATGDMTSYKGEMDNLGFDQLFNSNSYLDSEMTRANAIQTLMELPGIGLSTQAIALWIERRLVESNFDAEQFLQYALDGNQDILLLKDVNKKAFAALFYDIKPLFELLPEDEVLYLTQLLVESKNLPWQEFILEAAETISRRLNRNPDGSLSKQAQITLGHVRDFAKRWLKNHWQWAYEQIQNTITKIPSPPQYARIEPVQEIMLPEEFKTVQSEIEETKRGNLSGWRLRYAIGRDTRHLIDLAGETLEELEETFEKFVTEYGISCSVNRASIIHALDWLLTVPKQVEQIRIRKTVGEEVFRKLKRGPVRIFYQLDPQEKTIIFFVHQKQAYSYGF